jgi:peptide/nickel transport system ATP-binding protein
VSGANLEVEGLAIEYAISDREPVRALDDVTVAVGPGECLAVVGESGSGKSTLALGLAALLSANAERLAGTVRIGGEDMYASAPAALRDLRRHRLAFVFQNPVAALDPTKKVRRQLRLAADGRPDEDQLLATLERVGLRDPERVLRSYPSELSGGMAQRVGIAMALERDPTLIVADEPTAALDATLRQRVLELLVELGTQEGRSLVLLTHDLHAVQAHATSVAVMYGGRVVEHGSPADVFGQPRHPYTQALLAAAPGTERVGQRLVGVPGTPPVLHGRCEFCSFSERCAHTIEVCRTVRPLEREVDGRQVICHRAGVDV